MWDSSKDGNDECMRAYWHPLRARGEAISLENMPRSYVLAYQEARTSGHGRVGIWAMTTSQDFLHHRPSITVSDDWGMDSCLQCRHSLFS